MNHVLLAVMLRLARAHAAPRRAGLFTRRASRPTSCSPRSASRRGALGHEPLAGPAALAPLVLIHRSLAVPALEEEARVDPKTGLFNARHFAAALRDELARARSASTGRCR